MKKIAFIAVVVGLLAGCASQRGLVSEADYLALLPQDADIYLRLPVQDNRELAGRLVSSVSPSMTGEDLQRLTDRFDMIYGAVDGRKLSAVATGSFPKTALGLVLKEENGWTLTKDKAIPVTGRFYQYRGLPLEVAFPNSSTLVAAPKVVPLLESFQRQAASPHPAVLPEALSRFQEASDGRTIDFYVADVTAALAPFMRDILSINLPIQDMYGSFTPVGDGGGGSEGAAQLYSFSGQIGLPDHRALNSALVALNILARTLGLDISASAQEGGTTISISGVMVSQDTLADLVSGVLR